MSETDRAAERAAAVAGAMDDIAKIDAHGREHGGIDRAGLERIKERLLELAERDDLFGDQDFPPPDAPGASVSYRIAPERRRRAGAVRPVRGRRDVGTAARAQDLGGDRGDARTGAEPPVRPVRRHRDEPAVHSTR